MIVKLISGQIRRLFVRDKFRLLEVLIVAATLTDMFSGQFLYYLTHATLDVDRMMESFLILFFLLFFLKQKNTFGYGLTTVFVAIRFIGGIVLLSVSQRIFGIARMFVVSPYNIVSVAQLATVAITIVTLAFLYHNHWRLVWKRRIQQRQEVAVESK